MMGVLVPEQYGGTGFGYFEYKTIIEEIAKVCGSIGLSLAAHNSLCTGHILLFGNEEQKKKYLSKLATAEWNRGMGTNRTQYRKRCRQYENNRCKRRERLDYQWYEKLDHAWQKRRCSRSRLQDR